MDPISYMTVDVADHADTFDVYRLDESGPYNDDPSKVAEADVYVYHGGVSQRSHVEGVTQETSLAALLVPSRDANGNLQTIVEVGDELRLKSDTLKRYDVETKEGLPDDIDPDLWELGLSRANNSS